MRIGFATSDWAQPETEGDPPEYGGSGNARVGIPARWIARHTDHEVVVGTLSAIPDGPMGVHLDDGSDAGTNDFDFDVVVIQRWMVGDIPDRIADARSLGQVIVNDVDDWYDGLATTNNAWWHSHPRFSPISNRDHYRRILAASTCVSCSTPFLYDRIKAPRKALLRNMVDHERFDGPRIHTGAPVIGWVGAMPWRSGDVETLAGILGPFADRHDVQVRHEGHVPDYTSFAEAARVDPDRVTTGPMRPVSKYPEMFAGIDVGLVPLADVPFNAAKSSIKMTEYVASGVPVVAAASPENRWLADHGIGRVARRPKDWIRHLTELLDPDVRTAESAANHERLVELQAAGCQRWVDLYETLAFEAQRRPWVVV